VELPNADDIGGYQLQFHRTTEPVSVRRRFWEAHLESGKDVPIVCDPLLFFWNRSDGMMFRFVNTNIEGTSREKALDELETLHRRALYVKKQKKNLIPGHFYIDVGSVIAYDLIREYVRSLGSSTKLLLEKQGSKEWLKGSPVVIGNVRTNAAIKSIFGSAAAANFAYRVDQERFARINIRNPNGPEIEALKDIRTAIEGDGSFLTPDEKLTIGIVTRMPNPMGTGVMTFIASDGTFTTRQIAVALTDEAQLRRIFAQIGWRMDRPVPENFEMMFLVELWPGDIEDEGREAKLLCWRA
jgi:hypothetical protein